MKKLGMVTGRGGAGSRIFTDFLSPPDPFFRVEKIRAKQARARQLKVGHFTILNEVASTLMRVRETREKGERRQVLKKRDMNVL